MVELESSESTVLEFSESGGWRVSLKAAAYTMAEQPFAIGAPIFKSSRLMSLVHLMLERPKLEVS